MLVMETLNHVNFGNIQSDKILATGIITTWIMDSHMIIIYIQVLKIFNQTILSH